MKFDYDELGYDTKLFLEVCAIVLTIVFFLIVGFWIFDDPKPNNKVGVERLTSCELITEEANFYILTNRIGCLLHLTADGRIKINQHRTEE